MQANISCIAFSLTVTRVHCDIVLFTFLDGDIVFAKVAVQELCGF